MGLASALVISKLNPLELYRHHPPLVPLRLHHQHLPNATRRLSFHVALHDGLGLFVRRERVDVKALDSIVGQRRLVPFASLFVHNLVPFYIPSAQDEAGTVLRLRNRG